MKIYIGQIDNTEVDEFGEDGLVGPNDNGTYFGQYVEYGTNPGGLDEVAIGDGCGRMVPICVEHLPDLIAALQQVQDYVETMAEGKRVKKIAKSNGVAYVEDQEVYWDDESFYNSSW